MSPNLLPATLPTTDAPASSEPDPSTVAKKWPIPYYAVIFTSTRVPPSSSSSSPSDDDYRATADAMFALAQTQPGYLGVESHHTASEDGGVAGITVSYWTDTESIRAWRAVTEHAEARRRGKAEWYKHWNVRVARVEREYSGGLEGL